MLPTAALDAQQAVILAKQLLIRDALAVYQAAVDLNISDPSPTHAAAEEAADVLVDAAREALATEIAKLPAILRSAEYKPTTETDALSDLVYQIAYGLAPAF